MSASVSSPEAVYQGRVWLLPVDFTLEGYRRIFHNTSIWRGYRNSIYYTVLGTTINLVMTLAAAYALSRKEFYARKFFTVIFVFTMFFSGGLIPTYLLVKSLGLLDSVWAMVLPNALAMWNLIITRTYFQTNIPDDLRDAALIDGCGNIKFLVRIVIPLSKPIIAVLILFYGVGHWNEYFNALIYLSDREMHPLQLVLRGILIQSQMVEDMFSGETVVELAQMQKIAELIKYGVIIVASVPLLVLYPFLQRYFVKGIIIGSLKG